ncbi:glycosyltransferase family 39 protein [Pseudonocardia sp. GCM10023141]|uniref:glycosyltransferase family 39 protein n=1 Tax=Pseudonocardia sp. GCM10023141 TaxID=3252653 RepID=UPI0036069A52
MSTATLAPPHPPGSEPRHRRSGPAGPTGRLGRLWRGPADDAPWTRPALLALLAATAVLYLWNLSASGYGNDFYAASVQAGTQSLKAWLFGSLDAGNALTVDKPPAALWVMTASARIFGFSSWSLLVPQALEGVAAVALLFAAVRRWAGAPAGLIAGAALALTPAAVLMFRFDNPDALLTLLLVAGGYAVVRAVDAASVRASTWWLVGAGALIGFGFLTKMGQALLVVPAFGLVYLLAGPTRLRTRIGQLLGALASMIVSAGWFIALVELWPAADRPYIGGSTTNSLLELALGYNGIGRLFGGSGNGGGGGATGGGGNTGFGGATGLARLFTDEIGLEISWLLPAALILLVAGLWLTRRAPGTDRVRAALVLFGGWTLVTGLVFSFMSGTMHPYYTVALAPGIAGLVGVGTVALWRARDTVAARGVLALVVGVTAAWNFVLLAGSTEAFAWVRWVIVAAGVLGVAGVLLGATRLRSVALAGVVAAVLTGLIGTSAYAVTTAATPHTGSIPSVGTSAGGMGGFGGRGMGGPGDGGVRPDGAARFGTPPTGATADGATADGAATDGTAAGGAPQGGGMGVTSSAELTALLKSAGTTWSAAVSSSQTAATMELASGTAVMSLGGWTGSDATVTLAQFQADVAAGLIHYYVAGGQGGGPGGGGGDTASTSTQIAEWVQANFTATTVGGQTVYDLTA